MGQEQSYVSTHGSIHQHTCQRHLDSESEYSRKRLCHRNSTDSYKSDLSSAESSGYRSGSNSAYEYRSTSDRSSSSSEYYHLSLYKNDHYKDINRELYKPVKIPKEKKYKLKFLDVEKDTSEYLGKHLRVKSYLIETENNSKSERKKNGIRNYTPKILSEDEQRKKLENWV